MKILIAEDDTTSMILLKKVLKRAGHEVQSARNGLEALDLMNIETYDVLLTDWMMPQMDGIELIQKVRGSRKPPPLIIVVTALALDEARARALDAGADDYLAKPFNENEILEKIDIGMRHRVQTDELFLPPELSAKAPSMVGVCIAASTGGPPTLRKLFAHIKPSQEAAFFVVLHGPAWMFETYLPRLQGETTMTVRIAEEGMAVRSGEVYLAPGDKHMVVVPKKMVLHLTDDPPENYVRPSADPLFRSMTRVFGSRTIAVILTGMGHDGTLGAGYVSAAGGIVMAQDPATAILPSMPRAVIDLRIAKIVAPVEKLGELISTSIGDLAKKIPSPAGPFGNVSQNFSKS